MSRKLLLFFITILIAQISWGQEKQPALGILKLDAPELEKHKAVKINKYVESAFHKSKRFNIVTRQLVEAIEQEREQQKENIDKIVIQQGIAIGADYIVKGYAKEYKKSIYKSSPRSRTPYYSRNRSTTRTSPRSSTTSKPKPKPEKKEPVAKSKSKTVKTTAPKTSPKSPRTSSPKNPSTKASSTKSTTPTKSKPKKSPVRKPSTTSKPKSTQEAAKTKTSTPPPPPPSSEIDQVYTSTQISFTIKIINVKTGIIAAEETYKGSINGVNDFVKKIVVKAFPYNFNILEILGTKGEKKAKHVLLDGGINHGLVKGTYLSAYEESQENVDGKILKREILVGQLYVKRLDTGGNFSLCSIYRGKKAIMSKMKSGVKLICK